MEHPGTYTGIAELRIKAMDLGATEFDVSMAKNKRFFVVYDGKKIQFGSENGKAFIDHRDKVKQKAWKARHQKIKNKKGELVYKRKSSPSFWSRNLLWD